MELPKSYRGTIRFGRRTSTGDGGGETVSEGPVPQIGLEALQREAASFHGTILQVPPMVSAIKQDGERLYDLARRGVEVERAPRPVRIDRFVITEVDLPRVDFELDCGRGTYVRTLAEDLAERFGTVAYVESLVRTRVGRFAVEDSCRLISPPGSEKAGLTALGVPMGEALAHLGCVRVDARWIHRLRQGGVPPWNSLTFSTRPEIGSVLRLVGPEGELIALATLDLLPGPADRPIEHACALRLERVL
jgi:tRNA pseudouridine55 synthase